jgi:hypothetical protein
VTDDPNKLVRQSAGTYRTGDDRFEVTGDANRWFLIDTEQTDDLGQPVVQGPFATLNAVRDALPAARRAELKPVARPPAGGTKKPRAKKAARSPTWIDKLPPGEATEVRALIRALEREGIGDAEKLVQRDRQGLAPAVATRLVERRLEQLLDELPADGREPVRALIRRVAAVLSDEGSHPNDPLPGWVLVEVSQGSPAPPNRRIRLPD